MGLFESVAGGAGPIVVVVVDGSYPPYRRERLAPTARDVRESLPPIVAPTVRVPIRRAVEMLRRNAPCVCGSGRKFKRCCMRQ